jgi:hypothetical protein
MKIYGFYFIALLNNWRPIVDAQIDTLLNSNLITRTNKIYVRIFYNEETDLKYVTQKFSKIKNIIITTTKKNEFEFGTLKIIRQLSCNENFYCYYLHSKGVSINEKNKSFYKNSTDLSHLLKCVESWRKYMEFFIIDKFESCIENLQNGYDACGVNLRELPSKHFSGNFWWSKSEYIQKLPEVDLLDLKNRWLAERWIGMNNGNLKTLFETPQAGYRQVVSHNYRTN